MSSSTIATENRWEGTILSRFGVRARMTRCAACCFRTSFIRSGSHIRAPSRCTIIRPYCASSGAAEVWPQQTPRSSTFRWWTWCAIARAACAALPGSRCSAAQAARATLGGNYRRPRGCPLAQGALPKRHRLGRHDGRLVRRDAARWLRLQRHGVSRLHPDGLPAAAERSVPHGGLSPRGVLTPRPRLDRQQRHDQYYSQALPWACGRATAYCQCVRTIPLDCVVEPNMQISLDQLRVLLRIGLGELGFNREASASSARTLSVRPRAGAIVRARAAP